MKQLYQRDIYEDINEFILEYSANYNENIENNRGMDFLYKEQKYRLCREYENTFYVYQIINDNDFVILNICNSMDELLENRIIDNTPFKNIIMDEQNTIIYGKD